MLLFAATGDGIARLEDGRAEVVMRDGARCVAVDPTDRDLVYAGGAAGVSSSRDGGMTWEGSKLEADVFSVAVAVDGTVYAGSEPSALFTSSDQGRTWRELEALRSIPSAPTWSFPPRPWTSHVRWIAPSPHDAALLLVGIELGGLMRSEDAGATWADHRPGAQRDVHSLAWHPSATGRAYEAGGGGAAWSRDAGETWEPADAGRDRHYTWAVAPDPGDAERWFVSASPGPFAAHRVGRAEARIYRWEGAGPWEPLTELLDAMPYVLAFSDDELVAGLADGRVMTSADGGESWRSHKPEGDPIPRILGFA